MYLFVARKSAALFADTLGELTGRRNEDEKSYRTNLAASHPDITGVAPN